MNSKEQEATLAAARWWADQLGDPSFDNGDGSFVGVMATTMANDLAKENVPTEEQLSSFADALAISLQLGDDPIYMAVDYGPDERLANAAQVAGVSLERFPWKTRMTLRKDRIEVKQGYGAPWETVWGNPGESEES